MWVGWLEREVVVGWWWEEEKSGVRTHVFSQSSGCQARHIPEMECAALAFMCGTFTQCAACELNVPGVRMYVCAALGIYPPGLEGVVPVHVHFPFSNAVTFIFASAM
jgi:hypothetical protein